MRSCALVLLLLSSFLAAGEAAATRVWTVSPDGSGELPRIQDAIDLAISGDVIELTDGTFTGDGNRDLSFNGKALTLRSVSGDASRTILDAEARSGNYHRLLAFRNGESIASRLEHLTLRNGFLGDLSDERRGGALLFENATARITGCILEDCRAWIGGAVFCVGAAPVFKDCVFRGNEASWYGGAVAGDDGAAPRFENCVFESNTAEFGAGLGFLASSASLEACLVAGNTAQGQGAGLYAGNSSSIDLVACTLVQNIAPRGSGLSLVFHATASLDRCLLAFGLGGEALRTLFDSTATLTCSDIYDNAGGDWHGDLADQLGQSGNISADPLFCDRNGGDFGLQASSPCSDSANSCGRMGALPVLCAGIERALAVESWSTIKGIYGED